MFIDDTPGITLAEMRAKARRLKQQEGRLDLIVVDYLQLMTGTNASGKKGFENRTQEVSSISRGLKALAKEMKIPVVALSQLSRGSEQRTGDKKPLLSDLRESGSIEQDADVVAFIHREEYYDRENEDVKGQGGDHHREAEERADGERGAGVPVGLHAVRESGGRRWRDIEAPQHERRANAVLLGVVLRLSQRDSCRLSSTWRASRGAPVYASRSGLCLRRTL